MKPGAALNCKLLGFVKIKNFWLEIFKETLIDSDSIDLRLYFEF